MECEVSIFSAFSLWKTAPAKALRSAPWIGDHNKVSELFLPTLSTPEQVEDETIGEKEDGGKSRGEKEKSRKKNQQQSGLNRATNDFYSVDYPSFYFCPSTY
ncbi:hypothetical protein HCH54_006626 [Aspergillus fumigatus]